MKKKTIASSSKIPSKITTNTVTSISKDEFVAKLFSKSEKSKISEIISKVEKKDLPIAKTVDNKTKTKGKK